MPNLSAGDSLALCASLNRSSISRALSAASRAFGSLRSAFILSTRSTGLKSMRRHSVASRMADLSRVRASLALCADKPASWMPFSHALTMSGVRSSSAAFPRPGESR